jgi:hypothetical protein
LLLLARSPLLLFSLAPPLQGACNPLSDVHITSRVLL